MESLTAERQEMVTTLIQLRLVQTAQELALSKNWLSLADMTDELLRTAQDLRSAKPEWTGAIFG
jgi:hypothetical protein